MHHGCTFCRSVSGNAKSREHVEYAWSVSCAVQSSGPSQSEHDAESCSLRLDKTFEDGALVSTDFDSGLVRFVSQQIYNDMQYFCKIHRIVRIMMFYVVLHVGLQFLNFVQGSDDNSDLYFQQETATCWSPVHSAYRSVHSVCIQS